MRVRTWRSPFTPENLQQVLCRSVNLQKALDTVLIWEGLRSNDNLGRLRPGYNLVISVSPTENLGKL